MESKRYTLCILPWIIMPVHLANSVKETKNYLRYILVSLMLSVVVCNVSAQDVVGLSVGYEYFPYAELVTPIGDAPGLEIETKSLSFSAAFPLSFQEGKIFVYNNINYKNISFEYKNLPPDDTEIEHAKYVDYSFFMIDSLSPKWKLAVMINPTLASDFESSLTKDALIIGGILGLIRTVNENTNLGFGLAYFSDFGNPIPLPFIYIDWQPTPKSIVSGIIPSNLLIGRQMTGWFDLGIELTVDGNRFHGSPSKFGVAKPYMRYSEGTLSSLVRFHFNEWLHLNIKGGWGFYRNFEFYDGKNKVQSFDMNKVGYFSTQFIIGI